MILSLYNPLLWKNITKILVAAVKSSIEKRRETFFEESTTVSQTSEDDRMTRKDQDFSEESRCLPNFCSSICNRQQLNSD